MLEFIAGSAGTMREPGSPCPSKIKMRFVKDIFAQKLTKNNFYHWRKYHLC